MTIWIDSPEKLHAFCTDEVRDVLAVDTESDHFHAYRPQVCLIQVATPEATAFVDPLAMDQAQMAPLLELFEDDGVEKLLHSARNDLGELDRDYGVDFRGVFDTQVAARFLDYQRNSLDWLLEEVCGVEPGPDFGRFDWTQRPLPDRALHYAEGDVVHLFELHRRFREELESLGWLEAFEQQCAHICRSTEHQLNPFDPEGWRGLRGVDKLDGRGRATARQLYLWRHELCLEINRSPVTFFSNSALIRLAKKRPISMEELEARSRVSKSLVEDHGREIVDVIRRAGEAPIPPKDVEDPRYRGSKPTAEERARYKRLRSWRNETSRRLVIPGEFIATNATLKKIAANPPKTVEELGEFSAILAWHCELLGSEILDAMGG